MWKEMQHKVEFYLRPEVKLAALVRAPFDFCTSSLLSLRCGSCFVNASFYLTSTLPPSKIRF